MVLSTFEYSSDSWFSVKRECDWLEDEVLKISSNASWLSGFNYSSSFSTSSPFFRTSNQNNISPRMMVTMRRITITEIVKVVVPREHFSSEKSSQRSSTPSHGTAHIFLWVYRWRQGRVASFDFPKGWPKSRGHFWQRLNWRINHTNESKKKV